MINKWKTIDYLKTGNDRQKRAYECLSDLNIMTLLKDYDPILVGTLPIEIDIKGSDLDIVCQVHDFQVFEDLIMRHYGHHTAYKSVKKQDTKASVLVINFIFNGFEIELYATARPTESLHGYRHMIIEDRILKLLGRDFKNHIIQLKKQGLKTEPAFAKMLGIGGDPYIGLLEFGNLSDAEIIKSYSDRS